MSNTELYDVGLGFDENWQARTNPLQSGILSGDNINVEGSQFTGLSEASNGAINNSATNFPLCNYA